LLTDIHWSLQPAFGPSRRIESPITSANGRSFDRARNCTSYEEYPRSLMYANFHGSRLLQKEPKGIMTSSQAIGAFSLVDNKPRPNTCPPMSIHYGLYGGQPKI